MSLRVEGNALKRFCAALVCLCLLITGALADTWTGTVAAADVQALVSPGDGTLSAFTLEEGQAVSAGDPVGALRTEKVFSPVSGTVAGLSAEAGDEVDGEVLQIAPVSLYTVISTVTGAASEPETALVHVGEEVRLRCTVDGSHLAKGRVIRVDGAEFEVETTAGELYVGEAVYVYRGILCSEADRIGRGTVIAHATESVTAGGVILQMRVAAGDTVERGQWLFTVAPCADPGLVSPAGGIVISVHAKAGDTVRENDTLAEIAAGAVLRVTVPADEALRFVPGSAMRYARADDPHGTLRPCTVSRVLLSDGTATAELIPDEALPIGLRVTVTDDPVSEQ